MEQLSSDVGAMDPTGERMIPESSDSGTFWEHVYRYAFAAPFVKGQRVLDIACGEGYGSASLMASGAASVIGVDVSEAAVAHARKKYSVDARLGSAEQIPLPDASVDVIVSFETVEHVPHPLQFLDECKRVLAPGGTLIMSTPNKAVYGHRENETANPYHFSEMTEAEFVSAFSSRFTHLKLYTQRAITGGWQGRHVLSAERPAWRKLRGLGRLRLMLRRWLEPDGLSPIDAATRARVIDLILARAQRPDNRLNPFRVRPQSPGDAQHVLFLIAVARRSPQPG